MIIVYEEKELRRYMNEAVEASEERPVLIDRFLENAVEIDVDVIADRSAPSSELSCSMWNRRASIPGLRQHDSRHGHFHENAQGNHAGFKELARKLNVCGLMNIQFAVKDEQLYVIEVNPRASRTVPFVSKSIGKPSPSWPHRSWPAKRWRNWALPGKSLRNTIA